jgi:hypothetical protein
LDEANNKWISTSAQTKKILKEALKDVAPYFDMNDISYISFTKVANFPIDFVGCLLNGTLMMRIRGAEFGLQAANQCGRHYSLHHGTAFLSRLLGVKLLDCLRRNFSVTTAFFKVLLFCAHVCFSFAFRNKIELLKDGIQRGIRLQQVILAQAASLIEKKLITRFGPFRYGFIEHTPDSFWFCYPAALIQLALFISETLHVTNFLSFLCSE